MLNIEDIKTHLNNLIPDVIYFFNSENSNTKAFYYSMTGDICINEFYLFNKYEKMDLTTKFFADKEVNANNLAMSIGRYLLHEEGNKKYHNKYDNKIISLARYISEGKEKKITQEDVIKLSNEDNIDSGYIIDMCLGKYKGENIISYFDKIFNIINIY